MSVILLLLLRQPLALARDERSVPLESPASTALLVGTNTYVHARSVSGSLAGFTNLQFAEADAEAMATLLDAESDYVVHRLTGPEVDAARFRSAFQGLLSVAETRDHLFLYIASHGVVTDDETWLLFADGDPRHPRETGVGLSEIRNMLRTYISRGSWVILLDTCSTLAPRTDDTNSDGLATRGGPSGLEFAPMTIERIGEQGELVLRASSFGQAAMESRLVGHGLFTHVVIQGLSGAADISSDGAITASELASYVDFELNTLTAAQQRPQQDRSGDFPITRPSLPRYVASKRVVVEIDSQGHRVERLTLESSLLDREGNVIASGPLDPGRYRLVVTEHPSADESHVGLDRPIRVQADDLVDATLEWNQQNDPDRARLSVGAALSVGRSRFTYRDGGEEYDLRVASPWMTGISGHWLPRSEGRLRPSFGATLTGAWMREEEGLTAAAVWRMGVDAGAVRSWSRLDLGPLL